MAAERRRLRKEKNATVTERRVDSPFLLFGPSASGGPLCAAFLALFCAFLDDSEAASTFHDQQRIINCNRNACL